MSEFLKTQLDYIFFFYGAAFLLLVPICLFLRRRPYPQLSWVWLGLFGATHGVNEWLDLLALSLSSGPVFDLARLGVLVISFVCLAEFGRASMATMLGHGPGRWILVVMVGLAALGGLAGLAGLLAAPRYALGLGGALWAAGALILGARTATLGSRQLRTTALGMTGYALATGLVVNTAPFFPASSLNYDSFLAVTGVPIQLIRGLLAVWISASLCLFAQASLAAERDPHLRAWLRHLLRGAMAGVALLLIGGWFITQYLGEIAARGEREDYEHEVDVVRQGILEKKGEIERRVKIMGESPTIFPALVNRDPQVLQQANASLDRYSQAAPGSICYLMDPHGLTIASSNRHRPDSFVGQSYTFRPYFQQPMQGAPGYYWALGVTSKEMGYYASFPVRDKAGQIVGVAVIKRTIGDMAALIRPHYLGFIIDRHGIVVLSNRQDMVLRSLWPLSQAIKEKLIASRQFGDGPFVPILPQKPVDGGESLLGGERLLILHQPLPWEDWSMVILGSMRSIGQARLFGIGATLLFYLLLIGFFTIIVIIREGEERLRQLFENAADILILHDRGRIIEVNQQACRLLGYSREELLRMSVFDIEVGYSQEFLTEEWERSDALSGTFRRKNGSTFPVEIRLSEFTYRGQKLRLAAVRDITQRRQAEEALQAERQRLFNLLDGLPAYIYLRRQDYSLAYVNQDFRERFGDPAGRPCYEILRGRQEPCEVCPSLKIFATKTPQEWEWTARDGRTYQLYDYPFVDLDGSPLVLEMGIDITERKQAEEGLRAREEALIQSQESYRNLASQLLTAQEDERRRLARELHDDLTQRLAVLAIEAARLGQQTPSPQGAVSDRLKEMQDKLVKLSMDTHAISRQLHPSILDDLGLVDAIDAECAIFAQREGIAVNCKLEGIAEEVPKDVALSLYRIVQEGLRNISKHSSATAVDISLVGKDGTLHLSIKDNGTGFDPLQARRKGGLGLASMQERAYIIHGDFSLQSQPGQGTVLEVLVPLPRSTV